MDILQETWEGQSLIDQNQNLTTNEENVNINSISVTKNDLINLEQKDEERIYKCKKCQIEKSFNKFYKNKNNILGINLSCKQCYAQRAKLWYTKNKNTYLDKCKLYQQKNKEKRNITTNKWRIKNRQKYKIYNRNWKQKNKDKLNIHQKFRLIHDVNFRLRRNLRTRIKTSIKNNYKSGSAVTDLGCTIPELKQYIESKFLPGMSWENWSFNGWHMDHIKPLSSFNLQDRAQFCEACHYSNLQPLWAKDNLSKGDKILPIVSV